MKILKRLAHNHRKLILTLTVSLFTLAEKIIRVLDYLPAWLSPSQKNSNWWPFKPPTKQRTSYVFFYGLFGMTTVALAAQEASTTTNNSKILILIPVYALFIIAILQLRQRQLDLLAK